MSYQEKENIVNIISGLLITGIFGWVIYQKHTEGVFDLTKDIQAWGKVFLIFVIVSIVARIIIYIIFHIINAIANGGEEDIPVDDERAKLIKLKATRNSHWVFSGGFLITVILMAAGLPLYWLFITFFISGLISELIDNGSQLYYHRKGV